jgi:hypothetical protein
METAVNIEHTKVKICLSRGLVGYGVRLLKRLVQSEDREFKSLRDSFSDLCHVSESEEKTFFFFQNLQPTCLWTMASVLTLPITTPPLPKSYSPPKASSSSRLSPPHPAGHRILLPVGPAHLNHLRLALHHNHDFSAFDAHVEAEKQAKEKLYASGSVGSEDDLGVGDEEESPELLALDPKEWKVPQLIFSSSNLMSR